MKNDCLFFFLHELLLLIRQSRKKNSKIRQKCYSLHFREKYLRYFFHVSVIIKQCFSKNALAEDEKLISYIKNELKSHYMGINGLSKKRKEIIAKCFCFFKS